MSSEEQASPKPRRITLGFLLGWAWCIFVGVPGIMMVLQPENRAEGILFILSALAACPMVATQLEKKIQISLSGGLRIALAFGFAFASGYIGSHESNYTKIGGLDSNKSLSSEKVGRPVQARVLLDLTGTGTKSTEKFTTQANDWNLEWSYDCSNFGSQGNFMVFIEGNDFSANNSVNQLGNSGQDVEHYHAGGTFYLKVNSECRWHIKALG